MNERERETETRAFRACVHCLCVCEWQLVHMVPEVEKHIIPPARQAGHVGSENQVTECPRSFLI